MTIPDLNPRRIPLAMIAALLLQAGTAVWWAATKDSNDHFHQQRIDRLEQAMSQTKEADSEVLERLARIEERLSAEAGALDHIQKQLGAYRR